MPGGDAGGEGSGAHPPAAPVAPLGPAELNDNVTVVDAGKGLCGNRPQV